MKPRLIAVLALLFLSLAASRPSAAQNRHIVRTSGGLSSVLSLCSLKGCLVQESLDGTVNRTFLVTSPGNLVDLNRGRMDAYQALSARKNSCSSW
jgi:hypothetical protein